MLHVDHPPRQLKVVTAGLAGRSLLTQDGVLVGSVLGGQIGQRRQQAVAFRRRLCQLVAQLAAPSRQLGKLLALFGGGRSATVLAGPVLLSP